MDRGSRYIGPNAYAATRAAGAEAHGGHGVADAWGGGGEKVEHGAFYARLLCRRNAGPWGAGAVEKEAFGQCS